MKPNKPPRKKPRPVPAADKSTARWRRAEVLTAALITLWIAALHAVFLLHAGPLWRDEAGTVDFASMPTLGDIWRNLRYDNFPPLFVVIARVWTRCGLNSDFSCRLLGFLVGMGTLGVLWWCARKMGGRAPLLILALYAANPLAIRVGDSLRPYGLGFALTLLTAAMMWNLVQTPGRKTLLWAALAATLSVQCLYQNAFFIIAFSCGAWVVTLCRREWKTAFQTGIVGLAAALSLLPYWVNIRNSRDWSDISRQEIHFDTIVNALGEALRSSGGWMAVVWAALCVAGLALAIYYAAFQRRWNMAYAATSLVAGALIYIFFLRTLGLPPRPWYFLILMAPAALMMHSIWAETIATRLRAGGTLLALIIVMACGPACYAGVRLRESNVDLLAAKLKEAAQPGDLILISPWFYGVSLQRYLDASRWTTLPPMEDIRIHRYDLMKKAMMSENPIGPLLDEVGAALRSGHKLWVVGVFETPPAGNPQPVYPPYHGNMEMADSVYFSSWMFQISGFVQKHAIEGGAVKIQVPGGQEINSIEDMPLLVIQGWRE